MIFVLVPGEPRIFVDEILLSYDQWCPVGGFHTKSGGFRVFATIARLVANVIFGGFVIILVRFAFENVYIDIFRILPITIDKT